MYLCTVFKKQLHKMYLNQSAKITAIMANLEEKDVKKLKGRMIEVISLEEVSLEPVKVVSPIATIRQIPEGCKQRFVAAGFMGRSSISSIITRLNDEAGYEAYVVASVPDTHSTEYFVGHKSKGEG